MIDLSKIDLSTLPTALILGVVGLLAIIIIFVPIALRIAGLTGQQIADVLGLTMQFFVNIVREFRAQNKNS